VRYRKTFLALAAVALVLKLLFLGFSASFSPQAKVRVDSADYLSCAKILVSDGVFAREKNLDNTFAYERYRTPGYPFFLALFNGVLKIPLDGILFIQILLSIATAFIVYRTALLIDGRLAVLSGAIVLFDPGITVLSLMIMTETLFLFLLALWMQAVILYLKEQKTKWLVYAALLLAAAVYVRPVGYFLGLFTAGFFVCAFWLGDHRKLFKDILIFLLISYSILGVWHVRNHNRWNEWNFTSLSSATKEVQLIHSYQRQRDPSLILQPLPPAIYYWNVTSRSVLSLLTRPVSFKYFENKPLKAVGKIYSYAFMLFWMTGFLVGILNMKGNVSYVFLLFTAGYFLGVTVVATGLALEPRLLVPLMPFIAVLSAHGWSKIAARYPAKSSATE
jgi:hypothetical protein